MRHVSPRRHTCGRRLRPAPLPLTAGEEPDPSPKYGVLLFEEGAHRAREIVLAFDSASDAEAFAIDSRCTDYLVAPLSFLAPVGVYRQV